MFDWIIFIGIALLVAAIFFTFFFWLKRSGKQDDMQLLSHITERQHFTDVSVDEYYSVVRNKTLVGFAMSMDAPRYVLKRENPYTTYFFDTYDQSGAFGGIPMTARYTPSWRGYVFVFPSALRINHLIVSKDFRGPLAKYNKPAESWAKVSHTKLEERNYEIRCDDSDVNNDALQQILDLFSTAVIKIYGTSAPAIGGELALQVDGNVLALYCEQSVTKRLEDLDQLLKTGQQMYNILRQ